MTSYFYTYNAVFDAPVSGAAKLTYAYLCKCADHNGKSYPSHKNIAAAVGVCATTVKKALAELESAGLIAVRGQVRPDRGRRANIYTVIREKVKGFFLTYGNIFMKTLTAKARVVYLYFCRLASGRGRAFPAHKTSAGACGLSVAGVRAAIDELEAAGLIERAAQYRDNGGQRANLYTIIIDTAENDNGSDVPPRPESDTRTGSVADSAEMGDPEYGETEKTEEGRVFGSILTWIRKLVNRCSRSALRSNTAKQYIMIDCLLRRDRRDKAPGHAIRRLLN